MSVLSVVFTFNLSCRPRTSAVPDQNALVDDPRLRLNKAKHAHPWAVMSGSATCTICADELPTKGTNSNLVHHDGIVTISDYFKLVRIVLVEKRNRNADDALVVAGNRVAKWHFDGVEVVVPGVLHPTLDLFVSAETQVVSHRHAL